MKKRLDISIDEDIAQEMQEEALRRYRNSRSFSRMIEELWGDRREPPDIEMIKASRKNYDKWYGQNRKRLNLSKRELAIKCNTCEAYFMARPTDAKYCPACGSPDMKIGDDAAFEQQKRWYTPKYVEIDNLKAKGKPKLKYF